MANKKNPHSALDPNGGLAQKFPAWGEKIQNLIKEKPVYPAQFQFFIDGYHFFLNCQHEARRQVEYVSWLFENWSEKPVPDLKIDSIALAKVGHQLLGRAQGCIAERFVEMGNATDQTYILATEITVGAMGKVSPAIVKRTKEASAILDPFYTVDIYAAEVPSVAAFQRRIEDAMKNYRGKRGDRCWELLKENHSLVTNGRFKNQFGEVNFNEYEKFITHFEGGKAMGQTHLALYRYGTADDGGLWMKEKGVDALLIMGLIDAKDDPGMDAMCLFSNDSDFYPVLDRIKEETSQPLFLAVLDDGRYVSKMLTHSVGDDRVVKVKTTLEHYPSWMDLEEDLIAFDAAQYEKWQVECWKEQAVEWETIQDDLDARLKDFDNRFDLTPDKAR